MSKNKKSNKQKRMEEKKKLNEEKMQAEQEKLEKAKEAKLKEEQELKERLAKEKEEKQEKINRKKNLAIILFSLVGVFLIGFAYNFYCTMGHPFDGDYQYYYDVEDEHLMLRGRYVKLGVDGVAGWYQGADSVDDADKGRCVVWLDNNRFIALSVSGQDNIEKLNHIIEGTQAYIDYETSYFPDPVYFTGQIKTLNKVDKKAYLDYCDSILTEWDYPKEFMTIYELEIDTSAKIEVAHISSIVYLALAGCFLIAGIVATVKYNKVKEKKIKKKKKNRK